MFLAILVIFVSKLMIIYAKTENYLVKYLSPKFIASLHPYFDSVVCLFNSNFVCFNFVANFNTFSTDVKQPMISEKLGIIFLLMEGSVLLFIKNN